APAPLPLLMRSPLRHPCPRSPSRHAARLPPSRPIRWARPRGSSVQPQMLQDVGGLVRAPAVVLKRLACRRRVDHDERADVGYLSVLIGPVALGAPQVVVGADGAILHVATRL